MATGSNKPILDPAQGSFSNLSFARDGNSLYYVFDAGEAPPALYVTPVLGGNARTLATIAGRTAYGIVSTTSLSIASLSPDEKRLAFTRRAGEDSGLFIINLDGSGERQMAALKAPSILGRTAWSPDGRSIAYDVVTQRGGMSSFLATRPAEGGPEKRISSRTWWTVRTLLWLPDGRGLIATANAQVPYYQVWYVSYPGGEARRITNDLNSYDPLSLTSDARELVTVQTDTTSHLWVVAPDDPGRAREISTGRLDGLNQMAWAGNGNIFFEAPDSSGDTQIWVTAADGTGRRQITTDQPNGVPAPCGNDRHLVFTSYREGTPHIWRSDLDGGNVRQLTNGGAQGRPSCSPDGSWLTYSSDDSKSFGIWRMPIDGGVPVKIWDQLGWSRISPDGKSVLFGDAAEVKIIPANGGQPIRSFDAVSELGGSANVHWSADNSALLYAKTAGGVSNIWRRPLSGGEPKQITNFTSLRITAFALSRDGKRLALARGTTSSDVVLIRDLK